MPIVKGAIPKKRLRGRPFSPILRVAVWLLPSRALSSFASGAQL
jgi:hypothetical protein